MFVQDEDEIARDTEQYVCETCPVADNLARLDDDPENADAWRLFHKLFSRFTVDTHTASVLLEKLIAERDTDDAFDLMDRFTLLYDTLHPPPKD